MGSPSRREVHIAALTLGMTAERRPTAQEPDHVLSVEFNEARGKKMPTSTFRSARTRILILTCTGLFALSMFGGCPQPPADDSGQDQPGGDLTPKTFTWYSAFNPQNVGVLSAVWGTGPSDVFVVGGTFDQGEVYYFNGQTWAAMEVPNVPLLVWVFGFAHDNVYAVGVGGGVVHYDGNKWTALDAGTTDDLWGIWGRAPNDMWIVGGRTGEGDPVLMHFDGVNFTPVAVPNNDRDATSLFKVWGIGSKLLAVGEHGLIISYDGSAWSQMPAGADADEDFVSLWGTSEDNIVAVGGRTSARIAVYNGESWSTTKPSGVPGLNGVCALTANQAIVGGVNGYVGSFNPQTGELTQETSGTNQSIHAIWGIGETYVGVGGLFAAPYTGVALIRAETQPAGTADVPTPPVPDNVQQRPTTDCNTNGVEDATDISSGTSEDCDRNGVPDECEADADGDGVINPCDACPNDAGNDSDGDGVCDSADICPGGDDRVDGDGDGVPDFCDACPKDKTNDSDGDGVCDSADICPGGNDKLDRDGDGVPNKCDECTGNDLADADGDGQPDACDICPGYDDNKDSDGDGVPDGCDVCPGGDDNIDADGDGVPSACDACPDDFNDDSDGDGVCDSVDACPGYDDNIDLDGDGVSDGCDCDFQPECELGEDCVDLICVPLPTNEPDMEIGVGGGLSGGNYVNLQPLDELEVVQGFQGLAHTYVTFRVSGFEATTTAAILTLEISGLDGTPIVGEFTDPTVLIEDEPTAQGPHRWIPDYFIFVVKSLPTIHGKQARITAMLRDDNNSIVATESQIVTIRVECQPNQPNCNK